MEMMNSRKTDDFGYPTPYIWLMWRAQTSLVYVMGLTWKINGDDEFTKN